MGDQGDVWMITGCSTGIGRALAEAAISQGRRVVATARNPDDLKDLARHPADRVRVFRLDLQDDASIQAATSGAIAAFGAIDILVNNAGVGMVGAVEECTAEEVGRTFGVNVLGTLAVIRAVLPYMRAARRGRVIAMSSQGGVIASPNVGIYNATKHALEGLMEAMSGEVAHLGITAHVVEPGLIRTRFRDRGIFRPTRPIADYDQVRGPMVQTLAGEYPEAASDPREVADAILWLMAQPAPAFRLPVGHGVLPRVQTKIAALEAALQVAADWAAASGCGR